MPFGEACYVILMEEPIIIDQLQMVSADVH